jgi:transcriptional regulator with XRE-family HTH domain
MTEVEKRRIEMGKRITKRRQEINMTMDELAHLMGYKHRSSIQKLESGENGLPQDRVEELAGYLQMDPTELVGWVRLDVKNHGLTKLMQKTLEQVMPSEEEFKLLNDMAMLNADGQELVLNFINSLLQNPKYREEEVDT